MTVGSGDEYSHGVSSPLPGLLDSGALLEGPPPVFVVAIPPHGLGKAFVEGVQRLIAELADAAVVDGVAPVVTLRSSTG